ncbi:MAG: DUF3368 domain-containing protein [Spirulinaceae cyanobacterium]
MSEAVVVDSTCLIGLERIGQLDILPQVFSPVFIPPAVAEEVSLYMSWLTLETPNNQALIVTLKTQLDPGESEAIALAVERPDTFIILDDLSAREVALQLNLKVIGTVGLLLKAKRRGVVPEIKPLLQALEDANFRLSEALVYKALQLAGE